MTLTEQQVREILAKCEHDAVDEIIGTESLSALCEELLSRRAADAAVRDEALDIAARIAEAVEMQQDIDHGSANSGGAEQAAAAIRALKSKASP